MISSSQQAFLSLSILVLGNFDSTRGKHFVFLFRFLLFTHGPFQGLKSHAPYSAGMFLGVLPITMTLIPSDLVALQQVHCFLLFSPLLSPPSFSGALSSLVSYHS